MSDHIHPLLSRAGRAFLIGVYALVILGLTGIAAEFVVRYRGLTPAPATLDLILEPRDARMYRRDDLLGYALAPDRRITITQTFPHRAREHSQSREARTLTWTSTTDRDGRRITHPPSQTGQAPGGRAKREVWIFGCSYTFGWSVNDDQTAPWRLQERLPDLDIVNFGVSGYSTLQSLIQFEEGLKKGTRPDLSVLLYYGFHQVRNTLSPSYRRATGFAWTAWGERSQPYVVWRNGGPERRRGPVTYQPAVPFIRHSAFMNYLDGLVAGAQDVIAARYDHRRDITEGLVDEFASLARKNGTTFLLVHPIFGGSSSDMTHFCAEHGISAESLVLPSLEAWTAAGMNNQPDDDHPNARGQAAMADLLLPVIERALATRRGREPSRTPENLGRARP